MKSMIAIESTLFAENQWTVIDLETKQPIGTIEQKAEKEYEAKSIYGITGIFLSKEMAGEFIARCKPKSVKKKAIDPHQKTLTGLF